MALGFVSPFFGAHFCPPVGNQLVGQADPWRQMGEHPARPLYRSAAPLDHELLGLRRMSHGLAWYSRARLIKEVESGANFGTKFLKRVDFVLNRGRRAKWPDGLPLAQSKARRAMQRRFEAPDSRQALRTLARRTQRLPLRAFRLRQALALGRASG